MAAGNEKMPFERAHAPKIEELNSLFDDYEFKSLIAVGGMGAVYQAFQTRLDRSVAIKVLPTRYSKDETFFEAFKNEAKLVARLNHQNLVAVYDYGVIGGYPYLVMEHVFGQPLEKFISNELIGYKHAAKLMIGLCQGIKHAHKKGVVHRDIKPANIILTSDGEVKLVDFGIAKQCGYIPFKSGDMIFGTLGFAAPEMSDSPHLIDSRSDIYSIGATLCKLVTGYTPDDLITTAIERRHLLGPLYPVVFRSIRTDPQYRFQSVEELETAISESITRDEGMVEKRDTVSLRISAKATGGSGRPMYPEAAIKRDTEEQKEMLLTQTEDETSSSDVVLGDRYKLQHCMRQGSRMMVYKARDIQMKRNVQLRLFFKSEDPSWSISFFKILSDLTRVDHPNMSKVLDAGLYEAGSYIVYSWFEGERIQEWLEDDASYDSIYALAIQMLDGLEVASHFGFHHHTMNTFSVVRESRDYMKDRYMLTDIGVAEVLSLIHEDDIALQGVRSEWAAPELFQGVPVGEKTTLYVFSQLMLTYIVKGHPLAGKSNDEIRAHHDKGFRLDVRDYRSDLPDDFADWMQKLSEPDIGKRFTSVREARKSMPDPPSKGLQ